MRTREIKYSSNSSEKSINKIQILQIMTESKTFPRQVLIQLLIPWPVSAMNKTLVPIELELKRFTPHPYWLQHSKKKPQCSWGHLFKEVLFIDKMTTNQWNLWMSLIALKNYPFHSTIILSQVPLRNHLPSHQDLLLRSLLFQSTLKSQKPNMRKNHLPQKTSQPKLQR